MKKLFLILLFIVITTLSFSQEKLGTSHHVSFRSDGAKEWTKWEVSTIDIFIDKEKGTLTVNSEAKQIIYFKKSLTKTIEGNKTIYSTEGRNTVRDDVGILIVLDGEDLYVVLVYTNLHIMYWL